MSLASLTVDLTLGLAKFEADSGKAVQIFTRSQDDMARKAKNFEDALIRQSNAASRVSPEFKIAEAAALGLGDSTINLIKSLSNTGGAFASVGAKGTEAFGQVGNAAAQAGSASEQRIALVVTKLREAKAQADALRESARTENAAGTLSDDGLKQKLAGIKQTEAAYLELAKAGIAQELAAERAAQIELESNNKRKASIQSLLDKLSGVPAAYKQQIAALQESLKLGDITPKQFQTGLLQANAQRPDVQKFKAEQEAAVASVIAAEKRQSAVEAQLADEAKAEAAARVVAAQKIIDVQNGLTASYRSQLATLRDLRDNGALTPAQFKQAGAELVAKQPVVQKRAADEASTDAAAKAAAAEALALAHAGAATATAAAQSQVYAAFLIAQAAASNQAAQTEARLADVASAVAAATARGTAAQQEAYATKTTYIAAVNEEAAALFRTRDAQRELDAIRAGVSPKEAAYLAKRSGDRDLIAAIYKEIETETKLRDEYGKTSAEIFRQKAEKRGLVNTTDSEIDRLEALAQANKDVADQAARKKTAEAFVASTNTLGATINTDGTVKARSELLALKAAELGVLEQTKEAIDKIALLDGKTGQLGKNVFATKNQLLTLKYTLSDVIASAASGISPMTILMQQGGQVAQVEGGVSGVFRTAIGLITPFRVAVAASAAAVGALAYAFFEGSKQSKAFADSIVLTGGYAGVTEGQFNAMAKGIAASGQVSVSAAREFGQALISTGQIGPRVLTAATEAAARYGAATGKNAKEVAQDFAGMTQDVVKWTAEHNKSMNFVTAAQFAQIKSLHDTGHEVEAQKIVYDALNARLTKLEPNLGILDKAIRVATTSWHGFWDAAFDVGRTETIDSKIDRAEKALKILRTAKPGSAHAKNEAARGNPFASPDSLTPEALSSSAAADESDKGLIEQATAEKAERARLTQLGIEFESTAESYRMAAKSGAERKKARDALEKYFVDQAFLGHPILPQDQADQRKGLEKKFEDKEGINEADKERKSLLAKALQGYKADLALETDALKFHQDELQAIYSAGKVSLSQYYDDLVKTTADGVQAQLNAEAEKQGRLLKELADGNFKDPHERTDTEKQLNESVAASANLARDAEHKAALAVYERAAAVKVLAQQVSSFKANLLQLQGDDLGAAQLRAAQVIADAQELATRATPLHSTGDFARYEHTQDTGGFAQVKQFAALTEAANQFAEVQRKVGVVTSDAARAEEAYLLVASKGNAGIFEQDTAIYNIRSRAAAQLGELAVKAKEFADASTDPKIKAAAADLAVQYAKAVDSIDPALTRLRDNVKATADAISDDIGNAILDFKGFGPLLKSIGGDLAKAGIKQFAIDPLKAQLGIDFKKLSEGDSPIAKALQGTAGVKDGSIEQQKTATLQAASALDSLTAAANAAAAAMSIRADGSAAPGAVAVGDTAGENYGNEARRAANDAAAGTSVTTEAVGAKRSLDGLSTGTDAAAANLVTMGASAAQSGNALSLLPAIIRLIMASSSSSAASSGSGGIASWFGGLFSSGSSAGSGGATAGASSSDLSALFGPVGYGHSGGLASALGTKGTVHLGVFDGAPRYHDGALVEGAQVPYLKANEVAAILMGGPKGTREEVLHASDPRHRDNLSPAVLKMIQAISRGGHAMRVPVAVPPGMSRYHSGGVVGLDQRAVAMRGGSPPDPWAAHANPPTERSTAMQLTVHVTPQPNMSRDSATQAGVRIGTGIQQALRRQGG